VDAAAFAAYEEVSNLLQTALGILKAGQKAIWLTGHGMGGAIALIAASELDAQFPVAGIHTYNPSCAGKIQFADWFDATFLGRSYRFEATGDRIFSVAPGFRQVQQLVRLDLGDTDDQGGAEGNLANLRSLDRYIERLGAQVETERVRRRANAPVRGGEFGTADESR
jgi:pimeloyl-ACP methyl ester carboxylesterase